MFLVRFHEFWEVLVMYNAHLKCWEYPQDIPPKYKDRIVKQEDCFTWVLSQRHTEPYYASSSTLKDGLWICVDDYTARGDVVPSVFGAPLPRQSPFEQPILALWSPPTCSIRVAYHGTSRESFHSIAAEKRLHCTFGMLGTGVYVGSFWKACRFAARDQLYHEREHPTVMRILWKCEDGDILKFPRSFGNGYCLCAKCYLNPEQKAYCAHTYDWSAESKFPPPKPYVRDCYWKAGQLLPCKYDSGKWVTQNEEWVINPSLIYGIAQAVQLDRTTIAKPHYDPLQRDIRFL